MREGEGGERRLFCRCDGFLNQHDGTGPHCSLSLVLLGICVTQRKGHGKGVIRERRAANFPEKGREDNGECHQEPGFSDLLLKESWEGFKQ